MLTHMCRGQASCQHTWGEDKPHADTSTPRTSLVSTHVGLDKPPVLLTHLTGGWKWHVGDLSVE